MLWKPLGLLVPSLLIGLSHPALSQSVLPIPECQLSRPKQLAVYVYTTYRVIWNELKQRYPDKSLKVCYTRPFAGRGSASGDFIGWITSYGTVEAVIEVSDFPNQDAVDGVSRFVKGRHNVKVLMAPSRWMKQP